MAIHWVIKNTTEYRVETMPEVEDFHKRLQEQAVNGGYTLTNFAWAEKTVKEKGEVVDTYYQVKATFVFNALKDPENPFFNVEFPTKEVERDTEDEGF